MYSSAALVIAAAALTSASNIPPPAPVLLNSTKSGVLPTLPTPFNGVLTLEGAILQKGAPLPGYNGLLGPAKVQSNMPDATYVATLPTSDEFDSLTGTTITGSIVAAPAKNGTGVQFTVNFANFPDPAAYGPFVYHIHDQPVPADGNCTETLGHLDTTNRGEYYPCIATDPASCQTGDLAGKHGKVNGTSISVSYVDNYLSTDPSSPYFFGSKSITIHTSNTTRLTCANFAAAQADVSYGNGTTVTNGTYVPSGSGPVVVSPGSGAASGTSSGSGSSSSSSGSSSSGSGAGSSSGSGSGSGSKAGGLTQNSSATHILASGALGFVALAAAFFL